LLRNSIVNYYNQAEGCYIAYNQIFWKFNTNNANLVLSSPLKDNFDILNCCNSFYRKTIINPRKLFNVYRELFVTQWTRIAFRGKSYRVKCFKKLRKFTFNFGYSHWSKFIANSAWTMHRRRRQNYLVFTYNLEDMQFFKRQLPYVRFYNCYTMRGLRLKKQPIIRRFGKISQHISILH
jgi:hypothetical protein